MSLWVGQRSEQHFLFRVSKSLINNNKSRLMNHLFCLQGAMQDVRLVAGANGHQVQCPSVETECPTCGQFQTLQSVVARLEKTLQQLTDKVVHHDNDHQVFCCC